MSSNMDEFSTDDMEWIKTLDLPKLHLLTDRDVAIIDVTDREIDLILELNTPNELLQQKDFPKPTIINSDSIANAAELFSHQQDVRLLRYVPNKTEQMYRYYHLDAVQAKMPGEVASYFMNADQFAFVNNMYPYSLPPGVKQYIAWMKDMETSRESTAAFIARCLKYLAVDVSQLIIFERPIGKTTVKMVRGSFPVYRHVHVWWQI